MSINKNKIKFLTIIFLANFFLTNIVLAQWDTNSLNGFGLPSTSVYGIVSNILSWLLGVFFLLGLIGFMVSGVMYLTAAGDEGQIGKAKKAMTYSMFGVIVGLSGFVIIQAVSAMLNGATIF